MCCRWVSCAWRKDLDLNGSQENLLDLFCLMAQREFSWSTSAFPCLRRPWHLAPDETTEEANLEVETNDESKNAHPDAGGKEATSSVRGNPSTTEPRGGSSEPSAGTPAPKAGGNPGHSTIVPEPTVDLMTRHYLKHFPKDPTCPVCIRAKARKTQRRRQNTREGTAENGEDIKAVNFGDCVTADHIIVGEKQESRRHDTVAVIVQDRATYWLGGYPKASKTTEDTVTALQHFVGPHEKVKFFYSDGSGELEGATKVLKWCHDTSTPYRPQANGIAERAVGRAIEGTRAVLYASGFGNHWWDDALITYCYTRNIRPDNTAPNTPC
jgi:hypothetical protein